LACVSFVCVMAALEGAEKTNLQLMAEVPGNICCAGAFRVGVGLVRLPAARLSRGAGQRELHRKVAPLGRFLKLFIPFRIRFKCVEHPTACVHKRSNAARGALASSDCKVANPEWASINLGIMVCLECSGLHRQLGTHISKVRSLKLDSKCWEGALLAHMCSIGNTAFNAVWEANLPADALLPQYYANNSAVREAFILAKYQHHAFFKHEAGGQRSPTEAMAFGKAVVFEGPVTKLSGATLFGSAKWDKRVLKLEAGDLIYLDGAKEKGRVALTGATVTLLDDDEFAGHAHCFAVQAAFTGKGGKDDGRKYVFQCERAQVAVHWVQKLRYALSDGHTMSQSSKAAADAAAEQRAAANIVAPPPATFGVAPGVPACGLGQV